MFLCLKNKIELYVLWVYIYKNVYFLDEYIEKNDGGLEMV